MRFILGLLGALIFAAVIIPFRVWHFFCRPDLTEAELFWVMWPHWLWLLPLFFASAWAILSYEGKSA